MMYSARRFRCFLRKSRVKRRDAMKSKLFTTINGVFAVSVHHLLQFGRRLNCNDLVNFPNGLMKNCSHGLPMCISMTVREGESRLFGGYDAKLYIWERWFKQIAYKKNSSDGEPCGEVILNAEKLSMRYEDGGCNRERPENVYLSNQARRI